MNGSAKSHGDDVYPSHHRSAYQLTISDDSQSSDSTKPNYSKTSHYDDIAACKSYYAGMIHRQITLWGDSISNEKYNKWVKEHIKGLVHMSPAEVAKSAESAKLIGYDPAEHLKAASAQKRLEAEIFAIAVAGWKQNGKPMAGCSHVASWIMAEVEKARK
jgi:hypothetical protein